jgi:zinc transporter
MPESIKLDAGRSEVTWTDVDVSDPAEHTWLSSQADLSAECTSLLLQTPRLTRRDNLDEGLLVTLCGFDLTHPAESERPLSARILFREDSILTVHAGPVAALADVRNELRAGRGPTTPLLFLASLIISARKRLEPLIANLSEETDDLEDQVLASDAAPPLDALDALRRRVLRIHRRLVATHNMLRLTIADPTVLVSTEEREALNDAAELAGRYLDSLVDCRERALLLHDKIEGQISQNMAQATYNLTIIATVFLPLTFITGLLGMNVSGIPESHDPWGFWLVVGILVVLALAAWGILRWKKRFILG